MKKILLPILFAASTVFGVTSLASAAGSGSVTGARDPAATTIYPPTSVAVEAPVTTAPPLTVPPAPPLPTTGTDSSSTLAFGAVALGVGGGLVLVARSRRRRPAQPTA